MSSHCHQNESLKPFTQKQSFQLCTELHSSMLCHPITLTSNCHAELLSITGLLSLPPKSISSLSIYLSPIPSDHFTSPGKLCWVSLKRPNPWNSLVVQWLGLGSFTAVGPGSIPGLGTKILQAMHRGQKKKKKKSHIPVFQVPRLIQSSPFHKNLACFLKPYIFVVVVHCLFVFKHLYWSIIALQWCVSFCFITK